MPKKKINYNLEEITDSKVGAKKLLKHEFWVYRGLLLATTIFILIYAIGGALIPKIIEYAINNTIANHDIPGLTKTALFLAVVATVAIIAKYIQTKITGQMSAKILFNLREKIFAKLQELPVEFFAENQSGDIIQRITENVSAIDRFLSQGLMRSLDFIFTLMATFAFMFLSDWKIAIISALGVILVFGFLIIQGQFLQKQIRKSLKIEGKMSSFSEESFTAHEVIATYGRENKWQNLFTDINQRYYSSRTKIAQLSALTEAFLYSISIIATLASIALSLHLYLRGLIASGTVILFYTYTYTVFRKMNGLSSIWQSLQDGLAASGRIEEILRLKNNIQEKANPYSPDPKSIKGKVEFKNLSFAYRNGEEVLSGINFCAYPGQTIAIVGPTGAGKTTFVNLVARLYDPQKGKVTIDDVNVKDWSLAKLRSQIGYLTQDTFLFEDTVINNLSYNNPQVNRNLATKVINRLSPGFLKTLPQGLDTKLEADGQNLSAGQRQILALARLVLRKPKIIILDEATAKIDTKSEKTIQEAMEKSTRDSTSFIVAHRLSTIFNANYILVIQDKSIIEAGTHQELIEQRGEYYQMYSRFVK